MKILNLTSSLLILLLSFNAHSSNHKFITADSSSEARICILTASNNLLGLKQALKLYAWGNIIVTERFAANDITCNEMGLAYFARKYDAPKTFSYLKRITKRSNKMFSN
jgi:hypothetical protein